MPKPTLQEYQEAIQRPDLCFMDSDLKKSTTIPGVFGLPKLISGGFAGVFQVKRGKKSYAARCFLKDVKDIEKRYKVIHDFLKRRRISCFVKFKYIEQGILVKGKWYPILKMEWLDGQTLGEYVEKKRKNSQEMVNLAQKMKKMVNELKKRGISHGDLHDQNIMIVDGELRIIDYDAMFVPALKGLASNELGHSNYQHPERRLTDFGIHVDNFSEWVIYISLLALARRPEIWEEVNGGDQCLLFRSSDFKDPEHSKVFNALEKIQDDNLKLLVYTLKDAIYTHKLDDIPSIVNERKIVYRRRQLINEVTKIPQVSLKGFEVSIPQRDNAWIWDNKIIEYQKFTRSFKLERVALILLLIYVLIIESLFIFYQIPFSELTMYASGIPILVLFIPVFYTGQDVVKKRNQKTLKLKRFKAEKKSKQKKIQEEINYVNKMKAEVNEKIERLREKIVSLKSQEAIELKKIESIQWNRLSEVKETKKDLKSKEKKEKQYLLKKAQRDYVINRLATHNIKSSRIANLGILKRFFLSRWGIRSAADFIDIDIKRSLIMGQGASFRLRNSKTVFVWWISQEQANSLMRWRNKLNDRYKSRVPSKLNQQETKKIKIKYQSQLDKLEVKEKKIKEEMQKEKKAIKDSFSKKSKLLKNDIEELRNYHDSVVSKVRTGLAATCDEIENIDWEINSLKHQLEGYKPITFTNYMKEIVTSS